MISIVFTGLLAFCLCATMIVADGYHPGKNVKADHHRLYSETTFAGRAILVLDCIRAGIVDLQ